MGARLISSFCAASGSVRPFCTMRISPVAEKVMSRKTTSMVIMSTSAVRFRLAITVLRPCLPLPPRCLNGTESNSRGPGEWMGMVSFLLGAYCLNFTDRDAGST
jgi:hypothetical protein